MSSSRLPKVVVVLAAALLLGWVSTASASLYSMSGNWVQRRGVAYIPVAPQGGGIPGSAIVPAHGSGPATFTVPVAAFQGTFAANWPLPQPSLIQLSTMFTDAGPLVPGVFKAGAWTATRPFANFAFCPGATANPNCVDHRSSGAGGAVTGQGTNHGLVRYTAGANQFGGTMQMLSGGGGALSIKIGTSPTVVIHNPFGGATGAAPTEAPGGAYANISLVDVLPAGVITIGPGISAYGLITAPGAPGGTGGNATTIINIGFPWTTGTVYVRGTKGGPAMSTTVTVMGSDNRTPRGAGNITLVAGGIGNRVTSGATFVDFDKVAMTFALGTPSISPLGFGVLALLMTLSAGYMLRRRFA